MTDEIRFIHIKWSIESHLIDESSWNCYGNWNMKRLSCYHCAKWEQSLGKRVNSAPGHVWLSNQVLSLASYNLSAGWKGGNGFHHTRKYMLKRERSFSPNLLITLLWHQLKCPTILWNIVRQFTQWRLIPANLFENLADILAPLVVRSLEVTVMMKFVCQNAMTFSNLIENVTHENLYFVKCWRYMRCDNIA